MLIVASAIFALVVWFSAKRGWLDHPFARAAGLVFLIACVAAIALRAGPLGAAVFATVAVTLGIWWALRGRGDDPGDDGPDPPDPPDPGPGPGKRAALPAEVLDPDAFDRARAEWERELPKRG